MSEQQNPGPSLEIAHVLFVEIVGYSRLPIEDQSKALTTLQEVFVESEEVSRTSNRPTKTSTAAGSAVGFFHDPASPLRCALKLAGTMQDKREAKLRIGVHSGAVYSSTDLNSGERSVSGNGIDYAKRVMMCGDANHILASKDTVDLLSGSSDWQNLLHEVGEIEVEPGLRLHLFNCYTNEAGNPSVPSKIQGETLSAQPEFFEDRYRLIKELGRGAMGIVYEAEDTRLGRRVALKLMSHHDNDEYRSRFNREARAASRLNHPHIAAIYDSGTTTTGQPFIVMEMVEGQTLAKLLLSEQPMRVERAVAIVAEVAEALGEAHRLGIIHRDIKPSNVIINERGQAKVLDFGLAKQIATKDTDESSFESAVLTHSNVVVGTPLYLSPEQARGLPLDGRSDLFALGSVLYECLTGRPAFAGRGQMEIGTQILHFQPPAPSNDNPAVPAILDRVTMKALAKDPDARYQSAEQMLAALHQVQQKLRSLAGASTLLLRVSDNVAKKIQNVGPSVKDRSKYFFILAILVLTILSLSAWATVRYWPRRGSHSPKPEAMQLYQRGTQNLRDGAYFQASKALDEAVKIDNSFTLAHARLAEASMELDVTDRAQRELLIAEEGRANLSDSDLLRLDAIKATVKGDFQGAIKIYSQLQQLSPEQAENYVDLGRAYQKNDEIDKAIQSFEQAARLNPQEAAAFLGLGSLYGRKGDNEKALTNFARAEAIYEAVSSPEGRAEVFYQRGYFFNRSSNYKESRANLQQSLNIATDANNKYQQIRTLMQISLVESFDRQGAQAQQHATDAIDLARGNGFDVLTAQALVNLGSVYFLAGRLDDAEKNFQQGLDLARRYEARSTEAKARFSLGSLELYQGRTDQALQNVQAALDFYQRQGGYVDEIMSCQNLIGRGSRKKGDYDAALNAFFGLLDRAQKLKNIDQIAFAHEGLGNVMLLLERYPEALAQHQQGLAANESKGEQLGIGFSSSNCGNALWRLGRYDEAEQMFNRALGITKDPEESKNILLEVRLNTIEEALSKSDFPTVVKTSTQALETANPKELEAIIRAKKSLAVAKLYMGSSGDARSLSDEAVAKAIDLGEPALIYSARLILAEVLLETRDPGKALETARADLDHFIGTKQQESLYRAYIIAARASQQLNDEANAGNYANRARDVLNGIEQQWGAEAYQKYVARPDIKSQLVQLQKLPR